MIILDNIGFETDIYLTNKNQIIGSQNWIREYPSGLGTRCHQYQGAFTVEELQINPGIIVFAQENLDVYFDEQDDIYDKFEQIEEYWNNKIKGKPFSEEEWECLLSNGFLGVIEMICPELKENEVFSFYLDFDKTIRDLETRFKGQPYSEIIKEFQTHLEDSSSDDYKLWQVIQSNYTDNFLWIEDSETGKGGKREEYIHFLEIEEQHQSKSPLKQREEELSSLEAEAKRYDKDLKGRQQEEQDIGE